MCVPAAAWTGEEVTVYLPWREFVPVKRARVDPEAPVLDPARVRQLGIVLSRFEFNGAANPHYRAGPFELKARASFGSYAQASRGTPCPRVFAGLVTRPASSGHGWRFERKVLPPCLNEVR